MGNGKDTKPSSSSSILQLRMELKNRKYSKRDNPYNLTHQTLHPLTNQFSRSHFSFTPSSTSHPHYFPQPPPRSTSRPRRRHHQPPPLPPNVARCSSCRYYLSGAQGVAELPCPKCNIMHVFFVVDSSSAVKLRCSSCKAVVSGPRNVVKYPCPQCFEILDVHDHADREEVNELVKEVELEEDDGGIAGETFTDYRPSKLSIGPPHPDPIVETSSLSAVQPPEPTYDPKIKNDLERSKALSCLQIETLVYACQRHLQHTPSGARAGFFIGDGAGVGKGRTVAGLIWENWHHGRKKALWFSVGSDLKFDARRDLDDMGASCIAVHALNKLPYVKLDSKSVGVREGVIFSTYHSLIASSDRGRTRMQQLVQWCGPGFDGLIIFDECHKAKNLVPEKDMDPTKTGQAVRDIQAQLPEARVVYCSATGASEPRNMAYMVRLGLWGDGTSFSDFTKFLVPLEHGGVGALELVAMDMKTRGMYLCRTLSYKGAEFEIVDASLDDRMMHAYKKATEVWVDLHEELRNAIGSLSIDIHKARQLLRLYWGSHQVLNLRVLGDKNFETLMESKHKILERICALDLPNNPLDDIIDQLGGHDKVAEITGRKGMIVRAPSGMGVFYQTRKTKDVTAEMVNMHEKKLFMEGEKLVAIISEAGSAGVSLQADRRVINQKRRVHITIELPWSADRAIQQFGRTHISNQVSAPQYRILFSNLGGERRFASAVAKRLESLGALTQGDRRAGPSLSAYNYDSDYGKRALKLLYNGILDKDTPLPVVPPGCLSDKPDTIEDFIRQAKAALDSVKILEKIEDDEKEKINIRLFLNRLLGIAPEIQNRLFELFVSILDLLVHKARIEGNLDTGIVDLKATVIELQGTPKTVYVDQMSGASTVLFTFILDRGVSWELAITMLIEKQKVRFCSAGDGFYMSKREWLGRHRVILAFESSAPSMYKIVRPTTGESTRDMHLAELTAKYSKVSPLEEAKIGWENEYEVSSKQCMHGPNCKNGKLCSVGSRLQQVNVLGGVIFPIWRKILKAISKKSRESLKRPRIVRVETTSDNRRIVGLFVPNAAVDTVIQDLQFVIELDD